MVSGELRTAASGGHSSRNTEGRDVDGATVTLSSSRVSGSSTQAKQLRSRETALGTCKS